MQNRLAYLVVGLSVALAAPAVCQDQYGSAVGVAGDQVLVLKPSSGQGPAAVFAYGRDADGQWSVSSRLIMAGGENLAAGFSPSLVAWPNEILVGAGDPEALLGAQVFSRSADGGWKGDDPIGFGQPVSSQASQLDLAGLMRIMQPPARILASDGSILVVSVSGGTAATNGVRVMRRTGPGSPWGAPTRLTVEDAGSSDRFGAAVAVRGDMVAVGAPGHGNRGAVYVFRRNGQSGNWGQSSKILPDSQSGVTTFGSALAFAADELMVAAPGSRETAGVVLSYRLTNTGDWAEAARLMADGAATGTRFGHAMVFVSDRLWVGAPATPNGGDVYGFVRTASGWASDQHFSAPEPGMAYGAALGAGEGVLVVGAPATNAGLGSAGIYTREDGTWGDPSWVSLGHTLETVVGEEVHCQDGEAAAFDCGNVDLLAFLPISALGGDATERVSDLWGWTDPATGREYALVGRSAGIAFVDITQPTNPRYLGLLPGNRSGARDIKVYKDHVFFTGDGAGAHGLLVFDLQRLRSATGEPQTFEPDAKYDGIASAHNLVIDTDAGFAYPVGASAGGETCGGGLHMVDIRDPKAPTFAGCYTDTEGLIWAGRTHDAQCTVYQGPDAEYQGRQICFASNETALRIVDVTEKENPVPIAAATYPGLSYVHQGWLTDDQRYFYLDDELDELVGNANRTRTIIWDVAELDDPVLVGEYLGPNGATDHNLYVKGDRMYQANYQAGLRVIDISDPEHPVEVGYFDTTPYEGNPPGFNGAWTVYPFFESGSVIVTSMNEGLFVLRPRRAGLIP